jgi:lysophospholipase L1-like esterase
VSPRLRALAANAALAAASLLVVLLSLEAALRVTGFASERQQAVRRVVDGAWTQLLDCYPSNPRGYFELDLRRPENDGRFRRLAPRRFDAIARHHPWAVLSEYNHLRFRDRPPGPRREGARRVAVVGDSFTEGQGVKEQDTLPRALERALLAAEPGRWEVRNCGRRGLDFPELQDAFTACLEYEPDLVVYALVLNDAEQSDAFRARQSFVNDWILDRERTADDDAQPTGPRSHLFGFVSSRVEAWRVGRETTRWYLDMWTDANPGWRATQEHLRRMRDRLAGRGARLLVAPWPLLVSLEDDYPFLPVHETIRRFCLVEGIPHHDLLGALRGRRTEELRVHPVDRHPNEVAHRLAAESLAPVVESLAR